MDFNTWKQKKLADLARMGQPAPSDQELQTQYEATQSLRSGLQETGARIVEEKAAREKQADFVRQNYDNPNASLSDLVSGGRNTEPVPAAKPAVVEPKKPFYPTPSGKAPDSLSSKLQPAAEEPQPANPFQSESGGSTESNRQSQGTSQSSGQKGDAFADPKESVKKLDGYANQLIADLKAAGDKSGQIQELRDAIAQAKQERDTATTRSEWADLAQTLATAVAQGAAALRGGRDHNMAGLPIGQIDYGRRIEGYNKRYDQDVGAARDIAKAQGDESDTLRDSIYRGYKAKTLAPEEELRAAREYERSEAAGKRQAASDANREAGANSREAMQGQRYSLQVAQKELEGKQKEATAFRNLVSNQDLIDDLASGRNQDKVRAGLGQIAAQAGTTVPELEAELTGTDKPGMLFGTNPDPEARKKVIAEKLQQKDREVAAARDQIKSLLGGLKAARGGSGSAGQTQIPGGMITFRHKSGMTKAVSPEQAAVLRQNPDFTEVK